MSLRADIRTDIIAKLGVLLPVITISSWRGEEYAFNESRTFPSVYVAYFGMDCGEDEELSGATTYSRDFSIRLFVCTKTTVVDGYGDVQAIDILETIEEGLSGAEIASCGEARLSNEIDGQAELLLAAHREYYLYGQAYRIMDLESH